MTCKWRLRRLNHCSRVWFLHWYRCIIFWDMHFIYEDYHWFFSSWFHESEIDWTTSFQRYDDAMSVTTWLTVVVIIAMNHHSSLQSCCNICIFKKKQYFKSHLNYKGATTIFECWPSLYTSNIEFIYLDQYELIIIHWFDQQHQYKPVENSKLLVITG